MSKGFLPNAQNFEIKDSHFIDQSHVQINNSSKRRGLQTLLDASIPEALHDSSARYPPPRCRPGTRQDYIDIITSWGIHNDGRASRLIWLKGIAGVGKSSVAQSCAEALGDRLGASFFFSRLSSRDDPNRFFTTISHQLATKFDSYGDILDSKILRNPTLVTRSIRRQFLDLIVLPLRELKARGEDVGKLVIVVDGLDECAGNDAQCDIVRAVAESARDQTTPFFWVFFSRPEPQIVALFTSPQVSPLSLHMELPELGGVFEGSWSGMNGSARENLKRLEEIMTREEEVKRKEEQVMIRDRQVVEREGQMALREKQVVEREENAKAQEERLRNLEKELRKGEGTMKERGEELRTREQAVEALEGKARRMEMEVLAKEHDFVNRKEELKSLEKRLEELEDSLKKKEAELDKRSHQVPDAPPRKAEPNGSKRRVKRAESTDRESLLSVPVADFDGNHEGRDEQELKVQKEKAKERQKKIPAWAESVNTSMTGQSYESMHHYVWNTDTDLALENPQQMNNLGLY